MDYPLIVVEADVFREGGVYGSAPLERQAILGAAARDLVLASRCGEVALPRVDVLHAHDHHAAFAALWLRHVPGPRAGIVTTVHNARYHGDHPWESVRGLVSDGAQRGDAEHDGRFNSLKAAILSADLVSTVSPTHARELSSQPASSLGLDYAFRMKGDRLIGILNGIDTEMWDPATDPHLPASYSADDLAGKALCKETLCREHGLDPARPLLAFVGRLVSEKGLDAMLDAIPLLAQREPDAQVLILGTGERRFEDWLRHLEHDHPGRVKAALRHDEALAHCVYAGADILLMPSWHEPCGLSQMYALRYGTLPLVNPVGGLHDSIIPFDESSGTGNGAWMERCDAPSLVAAAARMLGWMRTPATWRKIQDNGMRADLSWGASAMRHAESYRLVLQEIAS